MTQPRPLHPALLSTIQLAGTIRSVALAGGRILAAGETGVYILRMATPETLAIENFVSLPAEVNSAAAAGDFGYAAFGVSLVLFDIPSGAILDQRNYTGQPISDLSLAGETGLKRFPKRQARRAETANPSRRDGPVAGLTPPAW